MAGKKGTAVSFEEASLIFAKVKGYPGKYLLQNLRISNYFSTFHQSYCNQNTEHRPNFVYDTDGKTVDFDETTRLDV